MYTTRNDYTTGVLRSYIIGIIGTRVTSTMHDPRAALVRNMVSNPKIRLGLPQEAFRGVVYQVRVFDLCMVFSVLPPARRSESVLGPPLLLFCHALYSLW